MNLFCITTLKTHHWYYFLYIKFKALQVFKSEDSFIKRFLLPSENRIAAVFGGLFPRLLAKSTKKLLVFGLKLRVIAFLIFVTPMV